MAHIRKTPKVFCKHLLYQKSKKVGYLQLVSYSINFKGEEMPHIEYSVNEEYRNNGIMTKELPLYLKKYCRKWGHTKLIAVVKKDNVHSIKLLERNSFLKFSNTEEEYLYIADLNLKPEKIKKILEEMRKSDVFTKSSLPLLCF